MIQASPLLYTLRGVAAHQVRNGLPAAFPCGPFPPRAGLQAPSPKSSGSIGRSWPGSSLVNDDLERAVRSLTVELADLKATLAEVRLAFATDRTQALECQIRYRNALI